MKPSKKQTPVEPSGTEWIKVENLKLLQAEIDFLNHRIDQIIIKLAREGKL